MKKYKHKITGCEVFELTSTKYYSNKNDVTKIPAHFIENTNDWEEIIEKDYEILSFQHYCGGIFTHSYCKDKTKYCQTIDGYEHSEECLLKNKDFHIHSVKRLSDGEIFTISDKVHINSFGNLIIESFEINDNNKILFIATNKRRYKLEDCYISKKPLFTTEDGVEIFEGDRYWNVYNNNLLNCYIAEKGKDISAKNCLTVKDFSTEQAAKDYIIMNKTCLSYNDINKMMMNNKLTLSDNLIELIKSKLNL